MLPICTKRSASAHASNICGVNATPTVRTKSPNIASMRWCKAHISTSLESSPRRPTRCNIGSLTRNSLRQYQKWSMQNFAIKLKRDFKNLSTGVPSLSRSNNKTWMPHPTILSENTCAWRAWRTFMMTSHANSAAARAFTRIVECIRTRPMCNSCCSKTTTASDFILASSLRCFQPIQNNRHADPMMAFV